MHTRSKGNVGENIACRFLEAHGYKVIARNYLKKWGEIDVIAFKDGVTHFVEVKSVDFPYGGDRADTHVPEENVHEGKLRKVRRMIRTYFAERGREEGTDFQFHVICVRMDLTAKKARIKWIRNVIL